jgi:hypothetical protein
MWAGRYDPFSQTKINVWIYGGEIDSLNPLEAWVAPAWSLVLNNLYDKLVRETPFHRNYWPWSAVDMPNMSAWVGPCSSKSCSGDARYNAPYDVGPDDEVCTSDDTYNGIPVADVTEEDLLGDDTIGMCTSWRLMDDLYWHDSDPGPDLKFGTEDDGPEVHKVTSADAWYMAKILMGKAKPRYENVMFYYFWQFLAGYHEPYDGPFGVEIIDNRTFKVFEERRFFMAFEDHSILLLGAKHIWEPYIEACGDPREWKGWERRYKIDPVQQRLYEAGLRTEPPQWLTYLIGFGPFVYHYGGWDPGIGVRIEYHPLYFAGTTGVAGVGQYDRGFPNPGDVDLEVYHNPDLPEGLRWYGLVDARDLSIILEARHRYPFGWSGMIVEDPEILSADLLPPSQEVSGIEISLWYARKGETWGPGYPSDP